MKLLVIFRAALLLLLPETVRSQDPNLQRVLNLDYGTGTTPLMTNYSNAMILQHLQAFSPGLTAISNFISNVPPANLSIYQPLIQNITQNLGITIYPAIGNPANTNIPFSDPSYQAMALGYLNFTNCIQVLGGQQYVQPPFNFSDFSNMINWLSGHGFQHIQLNPWPFYPNTSQPYAFENSYVDSAVENVMVNASSYNPSNTNNWIVNSSRVNGIFGLGGTYIRILANYQDPSQEALLASLSTATITAAFNTTVNNLWSWGGGATAGRIHWTAPWSHNFDPLGNGVWNWILKQYAGGNMP